MIQLTMEPVSRFRGYLFLVLLLGTACLNTSCSSEDQSTSVAYIPFLAGKEQVVKKYIDSLHPGEAVTIDIVKYDNVLWSHPDIVGYIKLTSSKISKEGLITHSNAIFHLIITEGTSLYRSENANPFNSIGRIVESNKQNGFDKNYVIINKDEISVFSRVE